MMEIRPILSALLRSKTGAVLVATQVALTLGIICNAVFIVDTRLETANRPTGTDEAGLFQLRYVAGRPIEDRAAMVQRDLETLRAIPGVLAAADANQLPLTQSGWGLGLSVDPRDPANAIGAAAYFSGGSLVDAFGLTLDEGRDFQPGEVREMDADVGDPEADTVILTRHLANRLFPDESSVVGKTIHLGAGAQAHPMQIVGVVNTLMSPWGQTDGQAYNAFIMPVRYLNDAAHYAVRAEPGQRARVMADAEAALSALRNDRVLINNRSMAEIRDRRYRYERAGAGMLVVVTVGLLLITASGIVGVASLWVGQRRKQIGVRRALGARRLDILRYFLTENFMITTAGIVLGVALAIGGNQLLVSSLELERLPLVYVGGGMAALWALGLIAVLGPAWRATAVPPAVATRSA